MDIKWLEDFLSLVQTRNFSRSAQDRHVTQSALSRRIQALEAWVGADLVDRSTYPLALTPAGKLFSASATEAMRLLNDTRAMLRVKETGDDVLRVSAGHALSLNFFPNWLNAVQAWYGPLRARILPANVHDAVLALVEGNCDLLLCYHHADLPVELDPKRFEYLVLGVETVMPVSIPNRAGSATFARLVQRASVRLPSCKCRATAARTRYRHGASMARSPGGQRCAQTDRRVVRSRLNASEALSVQRGSSDGGMKSRRCGCPYVTAACWPDSCYR